MLKLTTNKPRGICAKDMKDGDVGVITAWTYGLYIGRVVQRYKDCLICLGTKSGNGWGEYFKSSHRNEEDRVRLLVPGDELIVEE